MDTAPIRLYWWRDPSGNFENFGDELSAPIISALTGRPVERAGLDDCDLVGAGSVLQFAVDHDRQEIPVWGTGFILPRSTAPPGAVGLHAVRGPLSARILGWEQPTLGDPGLLAGRLLDRRPTVDTPVGLVPHYIELDLPLIEAFETTTGVRVISPLEPPREVIREIARCEVILSSSLHGLVVADGLGIPNAWIELSDRVIGDGFKFLDYSAAFSLEPEAVRVQRPTDIGRVELEEIVRGYERRGLQDVVDALVDALPRFD